MDIRKAAKNVFQVRVCKKNCKELTLTSNYTSIPGRFVYDNVTFLSNVGMTEVINLPGGPGGRVPKVFKAEGRDFPLTFLLW